MLTTKIPGANATFVATALPASVRFLEDFFFEVSLFALRLPVAREEVDFLAGAFALLSEVRDLLLAFLAGIVSLSFVSSVKKPYQLRTAFHPGSASEPKN